jgi:hypothetical protein
MSLLKFQIPIESLMISLQLAVWTISEVMWTIIIALRRCKKSHLVSSRFGTGRTRLLVLQGPKSSAVYTTFI